MGVRSVGQVRGLTLRHSDDVVDVAVPVRQELETGELAVDVTEYHCGQAYCEQEPTDVFHHRIDREASPDEPGHAHHCEAVGHVTEYQAEEQWVGQEHEEGGVDLAVGRSPHHIGQHLEWFAVVARRERDGREFGRVLVMVVAAVCGWGEPLDADVGAHTGKRGLDLGFGLRTDPSVQHEGVVTHCHSHRGGGDLEVPLQKFHAAEQHATVRLGPIRQFGLEFLRPSINLGLPPLQFEYPI